MATLWTDEANLVLMRPGDNVIHVTLGAETVDCAGVLWTEARDESLTIWCEGPPPTLEEQLLEEAEAWHKVDINPDAALLKAIRTDGLSPTSDEFHVDYGGQHYICQRAESLSGGPWFVYYVVAGQWDNVMVAQGV